jgi:hypothetical protein
MYDTAGGIDHFHQRADVPPDLRTEKLDRLELCKRGNSTTGLHRMRSAQDGPTSDAEPNKTEGS